MSNSNFWDLMDSYKQMFGEYFPLMETYGMEDSDIEKEIKECIDKGTPYKVKYSDGVIY